MRICPDTPQVSGPVVGTASLQWNCNGSTPYGKSTGSYALNGWIYSPSDTSAMGMAGSRWVSSSVYNIKKQQGADSIPVFVDATWHDFWAKETDTPPANLETPGPTSTSDNSLQRVVMDRHDRAVNVSFYDGHVETVKLVNLWGVKWSNGWIGTAYKKVR